MTKLLTRKILALFLIGAALITSGLRCTLIPSSDQSLLQPITLNWWGTDNDSTAINVLVSDYKLYHPNININYRKLRNEEFESELINALAEDRGPDIISLQNTDLDRYLSKLKALPPTIKMAYQTTKTSLGVKKETITEIRETASLTASQLKKSFLDVVAGDVIRQDKIYGLPMSVDTLVLYCNRDLLNNAGIPLPPTDWLQFQDYVKKLTLQNKDGVLIQSGAALGTANNVANNFDILSLLMMQNGAAMTVGQRSFFAFIPPGGNANYNPGAEALRFYTDFATPSREVYTWNSDFANSLDAFAAGKVAMMLGYLRDEKTIITKSQGKIHYEIAKLPQITGRSSVNYASYWVQTVLAKSKHANEAWDFVQFTSSKTEVAKYLKQTTRPTALRELVSQQTSSDQLAVSANQLLTAKSWYHGSNYQFAIDAFKDMVNNVLTGGQTPAKAAELAGQKIDQTL